MPKQLSLLDKLIDYYIKLEKWKPYLTEEDDASGGVLTQDIGIPPSGETSPPFVVSSIKHLKY